MRRSRVELKADLTKLAGEVIDELLDWTADTPEPTLTQIEDLVLELCKRLSERMALTVIEAQDAIRPVPGPSCPTCGREMHYKDMKPNTVESRVGTLPLIRGYYHCPTCPTGLFPWIANWSCGISTGVSKWHSTPFG